MREERRKLLSPKLIEPHTSLRSLSVDSYLANLFFSDAFGMRWPATEGIFSAIKRVFGETLRATSEIGMIKEASAKIWAYTKLKQYAKA